MRIALLDTYYPRFLATHYSEHSALAGRTYRDQRLNLLGKVFGTADFYSRHLQTMGHEAEDLIVNCTPMQKSWAQENSVRFSPLALKLPQRLLRLPIVGPWLSALT